MNKFYIEDPAQLYGCFRCGKLMGKLHRLDDNHISCGECNESGIVTFVQALDILNDMYLRGSLRPSDEPDWEDYLEFIKEIEDDEAN